MLGLSSLPLFILGCKRCCQQAGTEEPEAEQVEMVDPQRSIPPPELSSLIEDEIRVASEQQ